MIYLDTSFIVSLFINSEKNHKRVVDIWKRNIKQEKIISNIILSETITMLKIKLKGNTKAIIEIFESIIDTCKIIYENKDLTYKSFQTFVKYDSTLSLADALNVAIIKKFKILKIASLDKNFDKVDSIIRIS